MKEDQYDILRKKLNIDNLDDKTKKKLMDDFKKAGGKIDYSIFEKKYGKDSKLEYLELLKKTTSKASSGKPADKELWIDGKKIVEGQTKGKVTQVKDSKKYNEKTKEDKDQKLESKKLKDKRLKKDFNLENKKVKTKKEIDSIDKIKQKADYIKKKLEHYNEKIKSKIGSNKNKNSDSSKSSQKINEKVDDINYKSDQLKTTLAITELPEKFTPSFIDRILLSINGFTLNVSQFNPTLLNPKFLIYFLPYYINLISNIGYFVRSCIQSSKIKAKLLSDAYDPLVIDMLFHFNQLINEEFLNDFQNYLLSTQYLILPDSLAQKFYAYFRKIYFIYQNENLCINSLLLAFDLYKSNFSTSLVKEDIIDGIYFITKTAIKKFSIIYCININKYFSLNNPDFIHIIKLTNEEKAGYFYNKIKEEEQKLKERLKEFDQNKKVLVKEDIEKKEELKIPDDVKKGFIIMDQLVEYIKNNWDNYIHLEPIIPYLSRNDKLLPTYIFLKEFIEEYSIFLLAKDIQYKLDFVEHKKIDIKAMINNAIDKLTIEIKDFETYLDILKRVKETPDSNSLYKTRLIAQKNTLNKTIRDNILNAIQNLLLPITKVIIDYKDRQFRFIDNYEELIKLDERLSGHKKNNNKKVIYIFVQSYYFLKAFEFRLEKTDLSGNDPDLEESFI
ncbi:MAG: hypothetical protein N3A58_05790 [Spirochaetes bacterium]|nr:hypothetical protein [Spirochaetota bacterium]